MLLSGTLGTNLLANISTGKRVKPSKFSNCTQAKIPGQGVTRAGDGVIKAGQDF